jgi:uncharacterized protein with PIN domain
MSRIKTEEVKGFQFEEETVCGECATKEEWDDAKLEEIITEDDDKFKEEMRFCDRCKKQF